MKTILEGIQDWVKHNGWCLKNWEILKFEEKTKRIWDKVTKERGKKADIHIARVPKEKPQSNQKNQITKKLKFKKVLLKLIY